MTLSDLAKQLLQLASKLRKSGFVGDDDFLVEFSGSATHYSIACRDVGEKLSDGYMTGAFNSPVFDALRSSLSAPTRKREYRAVVEQICCWLEDRGYQVTGKGDSIIRLANALSEIGQESQDHEIQDARSAKFDDSAMLSGSDIADIFGIRAELLRKRLGRLRKKDQTCFVELPTGERSSRQSPFLYSLGSVRNIIADLQASSGTSSGRPEKKTERRLSLDKCSFHAIFASSERPVTTNLTALPR